MRINSQFETTNQQNLQQIHELVAQTMQDGPHSVTNSLNKNPCLATKPSSNGSNSKMQTESSEHSFLGYLLPYSEQTDYQSGQLISATYEAKSDQLNNAHTTIQEPQELHHQQQQYIELTSAPYEAHTGSCNQCYQRRPCACPSPIELTSFDATNSIELQSGGQTSSKPTECVAQTQHETVQQQAQHFTGHLVDLNDHRQHFRLHNYHHQLPADHLQTSDDAQRNFHPTTDQYRPAEYPTDQHLISSSGCSDSIGYGQQYLANDRMTNDYWVQNQGYHQSQVSEKKSQAVENTQRDFNNNADKLQSNRERIDQASERQHHGPTNGHQRQHQQANYYGSSTEEQTATYAQLVAKTHDSYCNPNLPPDLNQHQFSHHDHEQQSRQLQHLNSNMSQAQVSEQNQSSSYYSSEALLACEIQHPNQTRHHQQQIHQHQHHQQQSHQYQATSQNHNQNFGEVSSTGAQCAFTTSGQPANSSFISLDNDRFRHDLSQPHQFQGQLLVQQQHHQHQEQQQQHQQQQQQHHHQQQQLVDSTDTGDFYVLTRQTSTATSTTSTKASSAIFPSSQEPAELSDYCGRFSHHISSSKSQIVESTSGPDGPLSDEAFVSQILPKAKSLRGRRGRPRKKGLRSKNKVNGKLWEFIRDLLLSERTNPSFIRWERREDGVFKFVQSDKVAKMWGERKQNPRMTYEKLSRAMRYYYKSKVLLPVFGRRLVYKFGPNATGWMAET